jgi:hypothetical protein
MSFQQEFLTLCQLKYSNPKDYSAQLQIFREKWFSHYDIHECDLRVTVYIQSILATFERSLKKIFRPFFALVGEETANQLFRGYAELHMAEHFDLNTYGKDFGRFIKNTAPWFPDYPYLLDFANFCWHWHQVFLQLESSVTLQSPYPIYQLWQECQPEYVRESPLNLRGDGKFNYFLFKQGQKVCVVSV